MHPVIIVEEEDEINEVETGATAEATDEAETGATAEATDEGETDATAVETGEVETDATAEATDEVETDATAEPPAAAATDVPDTDASAETTDEAETDVTETDVSAETTGEVETEVVLGKIAVANVTVDRARFDQRVPEVPSADPKGNPMGTRTTAAQRKSVAHEAMTIEGAEHGRGPLPRRLGSPE